MDTTSSSDSPSGNTRTLTSVIVKTIAIRAAALIAHATLGSLQQRRPQNFLLALKILISVFLPLVSLLSFLFDMVAFINLYLPSFKFVVDHLVILFCLFTSLIRVAVLFATMVASLSIAFLFSVLDAVRKYLGLGSLRRLMITGGENRESEEPMLESPIDFYALNSSAPISWSGRSNKRSVESDSAMQLEGAGLQRRHMCANIPSESTASTGPTTSEQRVPVAVNEYSRIPVRISVVPSQAEPSGESNAMASQDVDNASESLSDASEDASDVVPAVQGSRPALTQSYHTTSAEILRWLHSVRRDDRFSKWSTFLEMPNQRLRKTFLETIQSIIHTQRMYFIALQFAGWHIVEEDGEEWPSIPLRDCERYELKELPPSAQTPRKDENRLWKIGKVLALLVILAQSISTAYLILRRFTLQEHATLAIDKSSFFVAIGAAIASALSLILAFARPRTQWRRLCDADISQREKQLAHFAHELRRDRPPPRTSEASADLALDDLPTKRRVLEYFFHSSFSYRALSRFTPASNGSNTSTVQFFLSILPTSLAEDRFFMALFIVVLFYSFRDIYHGADVYMSADGRGSKYFGILGLAKVTGTFGLLVPWRWIPRNVQDPAPSICLSLMCEWGLVVYQLWHAGRGSPGEGYAEWGLGDPLGDSLLTY